jgi:hypothetical protein
LINAASNAKSDKTPFAFRRYVVPVIYAVILVAAITVDLLTDRSGGAYSLATLLIAVVAAACFVVGQFTVKNDVKWHLSHWFLGAVLVLLGLFVFARKGGDAPKEAELIFTYAMLLIAPPASFVLPLVPSNSVGHALNDVMFRSMVGWLICLAAGGLQWTTVRWLMRRFRGHSSSA